MNILPRISNVLFFKNSNINNFFGDCVILSCNRFVLIVSRLSLCLVCLFPKDEFEALFRRYDPEASFLYLKTFRRAKVKMTTSEASLIARVQMHKHLLSCGTEIKCYFAQVSEISMFAQG